MFCHLTKKLRLPKGLCIENPLIDHFCPVTTVFIMFLHGFTLFNLSPIFIPHFYKTSSPCVTLCHHSRAYTFSLSCMCRLWTVVCGVYERMVGSEDGWGRKHKLQAGLLLLAVSLTSVWLFLSTPEHATIVPSSLLIIRSNCTHIDT